MLTKNDEKPALRCGSSMMSALAYSHELLTLPFGAWRLLALGVDDSCRVKPLTVSTSIPVAADTASLTLRSRKSS